MIKWSKDMHVRIVKKTKSTIKMMNLYGIWLIYNFLTKTYGLSTILKEWKSYRNFSSIIILYRILATSIIWFTWHGLIWVSIKLLRSRDCQSWRSWLIFQCMTIKSKKLKALKVFATLRETLWGVVGEVSGTCSLPPDKCEAYTDMNFKRFLAAKQRFESAQQQWWCDGGLLMMELCGCWCADRTRKK